MEDNSSAVLLEDNSSHLLLESAAVAVSRKPVVFVAALSIWAVFIVVPWQLEHEGLSGGVDQRYLRLAGEERVNRLARPGTGRIPIVVEYHDPAGRQPGIDELAAGQDAAEEVHIDMREGDALRFDGGSLAVW